MAAVFVIGHVLVALIYLFYARRRQGGRVPELEDGAVGARDEGEPLRRDQARPLPRDRVEAEAEMSAAVAGGRSVK